MSKWKTNTEYKNYLICKSVSYYSDKDEDAFFEWINKIECIESISAVGDELYLDLVDRELNNNDIDDLIGLFARYQIDMKQLGKYKTEKNAEAFNPWRKEIFEKTK